MRMDYYRRTKGSLIREKRGPMSLRAVAALSNNGFSPAALHKWEHDEAQPTLDKLPHLLMALDCTYEEISEPVNLALS